MAYQKRNQPCFILREACVFNDLCRLSRDDRDEPHVFGVEAVTGYPIENGYLAEEASPVEQGNGQNGVDGRIPRGALEARVVKRVIHHERLLVRLHPSDQAGAGAEKPLARRERSGPDQRLKRVISRVKQRNDPLFGAGCPCGASDDQLQNLLEASSATYGKRQLIQ